MSSAVAILETPVLVESVERSADPVAARAGLERLLEAQPAVADALRDDDLVREALVAVICASRSLTAALVSDPTLVDVLRDTPTDRLGWARDAAAFRASSSAARAADDDAPRALRRWKRRE